MKKTFFKNLFRDIKKTFSRFISVVIIIAIGVAFYAGVRATSPDMKKSGDAYLSDNNFMDFKVMSTLGITKDDISEVEKQTGISQAQGAFSIDAVVEKNKHSLVLNVNSIPPKDGINKIRLVGGRMANNDNEAVVEERFLKENKFKIGDVIELKSGKDTSIDEDLKNSKFKIVGSAQSPLYMSAQRQLSSVGNGSVKGFVYILPDVFKSDAYTEMYVKISSDKSKTSLLNNEEYKKVIENIENRLKDMGTERNEIRYNDVIKTSQNKISDAESKLSSSKKETADKFASGEKQITDANSEIAKQESEIEKNQALLNEKTADGEKQIADGKNQISDSEEKLITGKQNAANSISSTIENKVNDAKKLFDSDPNNSAYVAQYNTLNTLYENDIKGKDFDSMYSSLKNQGALEQMKPYFDIESLNNNFNNAVSEIQINKDKISASEAELNKAKQEGQSKIDDGIEKIQEGKKKIDENTQKLKAEEEKANTEIKNAEEEIQKNKDKIKDIKKPDWYVLGRSTNVGYETYKQDSDRIDNIGKAFPLIFFLVSALVSLTTMTRMVQENRIEIGTFKALGYSRVSIVAYYLIYSLLASITGSIVGISFGFRLFPPLIITAYGSLYAIPKSVVPFNSKIAFEASLIAILFTTLATVTATLEELRESPASLMRPKPPKSGKTILLERITFIWKRLKFTSKVTARNIFRYKQRLFMTVIGIAACTGLMITGFGLKGGIIGATEKQYSEIYKYDMQTTLNKNIDVDKKNSVKNKVLEDSNVKSVLFTYSKNATVKDKNSQNQDTYIVVPEQDGYLNKYINLTMNGEKLKLEDNGVIITEKLSKLINKKIGDTVEITLNNKNVKAKISAITEQYIQHYIYMSPEYYKNITGESVEFNGFYGLLKSTSDSFENATTKKIAAIGDVGSVSYKNNTHVDIDKSVKSINSVVLILIISAGALAFVVIFNLTNININERKRELATIKLLGFYNNELAAYIYRENVILTIIGSLLGIVVGILLDNFVISTAETNVMMFLKTINPIYFVYSIILTISFSIIVNLAMYKEFGKIDMIESLKSAE